MNLGRTLTVFAGTLALISSLSFAQTPGGTGTNNQADAPQNDSALNPAAPDLLVPEVTTSNKLPDGTEQDITFSSATSFDEEQSAELGDFLKANIDETTKAGGKVVVLVINPDQPVRPWLAKYLPYAPVKDVSVFEKQLPKTFNDHANDVFDKVWQQIKFDGPYLPKVAQFGKDYWHDTRYFLSKETDTREIGKGRDPFIIKLSLYKIAVSATVPYIVAVITHGLTNISPHYAFLPYLSIGMLSGTVFTYLIPLLTWNRHLPLPNNTAFWKTVEFSIRALIYVGSEGGFDDAFILMQHRANLAAVSAGKLPPFPKIMTEHQNWGFPDGNAWKSSEAQLPFDFTYDHVAKMGYKEQKALLNSNPDLAKQVYAARAKIRRNHAIKSTLVSVAITVAGLVGVEGSILREVGYSFLYLGAAVTIYYTYDIPQKISMLTEGFKSFVEYVRNVFEPEPIKLPRILDPGIIAPECDGLASSFRN